MANGVEEKALRAAPSFRVDYTGQFTSHEPLHFST